MASKSTQTKLKHVQDELLKRWAPAPEYAFNDAVTVARLLVQRAEPEQTWALIESMVPRWYPVDATQVAPVVVRSDPLVGAADDTTTRRVDTEDPASSQQVVAEWITNGALR